MSGKTSEQEQANALDRQELDALVRYLNSIGLERLAKDVIEEQFARKILEARVAHDYYAVQAQIWKDREERSLDYAVSTQAALFDKAASYNNVVTTLGYAGFFSVWTLVSSELSRNENAVVGLCLGFSLLLFVLWTLLNSFLITVNFRKYAVIEVAEFATFDEALDAHKKAEDRVNRANLRMQRFWPYQFFVSALSALVAGGIVLTELFFQIIGIEFNLIDRMMSGPTP